MRDNTVLTLVGSAAEDRRDLTERQVLQLGIGKAFLALERGRVEIGEVCEHAETTLTKLVDLRGLGLRRTLLGLRSAVNQSKDNEDVSLAKDTD